MIFFYHKHVDITLDVTMVKELILPQKMQKYITSFVWLDGKGHSECFCSVLVLGQDMAILSAPSRLNKKIRHLTPNLTRVRRKNVKENLW